MMRLPLRLPAARWAGALAALALLATAADAAPIKLARHPDYHNGKIAFSYLGDLWIANEDGSQPMRLTVHHSRDDFPRFSPDGKWIAFSSNRYGNNDVFLIPATGGKAKQLTFHSSADTVVDWSPDSKKVVFTSSRGMLFPGIPNLYEVSVTGGLEQPILTDWGTWGCYSPDGSKLAFNRHPAAWSRKHYRGSYSADLWVMDVKAHTFKRILDDKLPDEMKPNNFWPMYAPDGWVYFVSDRGVMAKSGTPEVMKSANNIWKIREEGGEPVQVTRHANGALFFPSMSADGKTIVYEQDFGLCKLDVASGKSTEIMVNIESDDSENMLLTLAINSEADSYHLSPSGKRAVISIRGELFTIATEKGEVRRLTSTPGAREVQPQWSPDGKWIAFVGEQNGTDEIFLCNERGEQMKPISKGDSEKSQPRWSPDGKSLLYGASDNKLYRYDVDTSKTSALASSASPISNPQWSPDGKWVSYHRVDVTHLPHVYVIPSAGGQERRITGDKTYSDSSALWTPDGKRIVYLAGMDIGNIGQAGKSQTQIYSVLLTPETTDPLGKGIDSEEEAQKAAQAKPAGGGKGQPKVDVQIDFNRMDRRARQLTKAGDAVSSATITPNGQNVVFVTTGTEGGRQVRSIWQVSMDGTKTTRLMQSVVGAAEGGGPPGGGGGLGGGFSSLQFTKDGRTLFYQQGKGIYGLAVGGGASDTPAAPKGGAKKGAPTGGTTEPVVGGSTGGTGRKVTFTARIDIDRKAEYRQVFNEAWFIMKHRFYDSAMHGVDWVKMKSVYEPLLQHVGDREELHSVVSMMIGELNASHTGISGGGGGRAGEGINNATRYPGFELEPDKSGFYKVKLVYKEGPADKDFIKIRPGDYVLALDEVPLKSGDNYWKLYTESSGTRMNFTVNDKPALDGAWKASVQPIPVGQLSNLQYQKWVEDRRAIVDRLSNGQIGYLHIRQMNQPSLQQFERDLAMLHTKKALVIDQRFNPGGGIDQELLQILQQKQYQYTKSRGNIEVTRPLRGFFGPMVVMANERSTSDAEVFPDGFKTLKLGKVVGVTTYGAVIGTGSYSLMDGSSIRTPATGLWNVSGLNLENNGVPPDIYVDNTPEDFFRGRDAQLERAVEELQREVAKRK